MPSNRRRHTVSRRHVPSDRRQHKVFVFQAIDERSSTNTLNDEQQRIQRAKDNWPRAQLTTHSDHTHQLSRCTLVRSHCTHARATHSPYKHKLQENCMPVSRTNSLSLLNGNQKKNRKEKEKRNTHSPYKHKLHKTRKMYECHV